MNIEIFKNGEFGEIRTLEEDGKIMFCGSDVARALGYSDTAKAMKQHCKKDGWVIRPVIDNKGRTQQAKFINEGNLYRLITHSKLPSAEKFESWVFDEVLPSIRKSGKYELPKDPMDVMRLMFKVSEQHEENINVLVEKVDELGDNAPLSPSEYSYITKLISDRINFVKTTYSKTEATKLYTRELYRAINKDINSVAGVYTRSQLRKKHFNTVVDLVKIWMPSAALNMRLEQLSLESVG